jgi:membrane-associated phospholipid phosphatase
VKRLEARGPASPAPAEAAVAARPWAWRRPLTAHRWTFRLPALVPWLRFKPGYALIWAPYIAAYQIANRFPLREPVELSMTALDRAIPFWPQLLPLYVSYLVYYFFTVARLENAREVNRVFYATHLQLLLSLVFFVAYPVRMPRELFYAPEAYNWADAFWRWFDGPNNCFPSLHASNVLLLMHVNWRRPGRWLALLLGAAIIASPLFVKQHYAVDLLGGALVYAVALAFLARLEVSGVDGQGRARARVGARAHE